SNPPAPVHRLVSILVVATLGLATIMARLVVLQVRDAHALASRAVDQRVRDLTLPASRGTIFDRNGGALAMSLPAKDVYADPLLVRDPRGEARIIAQTLHIRARDVRPLLTETADPRGTPIHSVYVQRG